MNFEQRKKEIPVYMKEMNDLELALLIKQSRQLRDDETVFLGLLEMGNRQKQHEKK